jgi:hypothetical protein
LIGGADAPDLAFLDQRSSRLVIEPQVADLVEEQRPAASRTCRAAA